MFIESTGKRIYYYTDRHSLFVQKVIFERKKMFICCTNCLFLLAWNEVSRGCRNKPPYVTNCK